MGAHTLEVAVVLVVDNVVALAKSDDLEGSGSHGGLSGKNSLDQKPLRGGIIEIGQAPKWRAPVNELPSVQLAGIGSQAPLLLHDLNVKRFIMI